MFNNIVDGFGKLFDKFSSKKILTQEDIDSALRQVRVALLEADVALSVAREFVADIKNTALEQDLLNHANPGEKLLEIVNAQLVKLLGEQKSELNLLPRSTDRNFAVILMLGLQGAGKTTSSVKLAWHLENKLGKKTLLASLDTQRPAAQEQLEIASEQAGLKSLEIVPNQQSLDITKRALSAATDYDVLILDSAGRLAIDEALMGELLEIKQLANPSESLLVADSLMGQDALNVASTFNEKIGVSGVILTRIDSDGRGGAALSMRAATNCPIKYLGTGEKFSDFEEFHPDRIASRILDMGDIASLIDKTQDIIGKEDPKDLAAKMQKGEFNFEDLLSQIKNIKKIGGVSSVLKMLPGMGKMKEAMAAAQDGKMEFGKQEALIYSMTKAERKNPKLLNSSRKNRIAAGAGSTIQEVNSLMKKIKQMNKASKKMAGMAAGQDPEELMKKLGGGMPPIN